jgi:hypothetical protein
MLATIMGTRKNLEVFLLTSIGSAFKVTKALIGIHDGTEIVYQATDQCAMVHDQYRGFENGRNRTVMFGSDSAIQEVITLRTLA